MAGLTATGLEIRTQAELQALLEQAVSEAIPGIDLSRGPEQQIIGITAEELALAWETLQAVYAAFDPDASEGALLDRLLALTGSTRRAPTYSRVTASCNLNAGATLPAGSRAAVNTDPDAIFESIADATNSGGAAADVDVVFQALATGPVAAPAGSLTVRVSAVAGWNSITNAADAMLGKDVALDPEARTQRLVELAGRGSNSEDAIRATVAKVTNVIEVQVYANESLNPDLEGRPGKSVEAVIWDGVTMDASSDEIAQAILDSKPAGIETFGATTGNATTGTGTTAIESFTRATKRAVLVSATVVLAPGTGPDWQDEAKAAISARGDEYTVGEKAYASHVTCVLQDLASVEAVTACTLDGGGSVDPAYDEILRFDTGDITLLVAL